MVSDHFSTYNHLPTQQPQLCWAHLICDLNAIAEHPGASAGFGAELLDLQQQLFGHWHRYEDGMIDWPGLQQSCRPIRQAFEARLQRVVELGCQRGERTPWAKTVSTAQQILRLVDGLWIFLKIDGIELLRVNPPWPPAIFIVAGQLILTPNSRAAVALPRTIGRTCR